uniref:Uncharacterized protein n=1 Tax=Arundo donax TaxID=35708 RepID=A0A0A8ZMY0_ARUDO
MHSTTQLNYHYCHSILRFKHSTIRDLLGMSKLSCIVMQRSTRFFRFHSYNKLQNQNANFL